MTKLRKAFASILCFMLLAQMFIPLSMAEVAQTPSVTKALDIILLIDHSQSMDTVTQRAEMSKKAVQDFIELLPDTTDLRMGAVLYANDICHSLALQPYDNNRLTNFYNNYMNESDRDQYRGTDVSIALEWAVNQFNNNARASEKHIIIMGDGKNEAATAGDDVRQRDAIERAKQSDDKIKIHTIAIKPEPAFSSAFSAISGPTGGISVEPNDDSEIRSSMDRILEAITGVEIGPGEDEHLPPNVWTLGSSYLVQEGAAQLTFYCTYVSDLEMRVYPPQQNRTVFFDQSNLPAQPYAESGTYENDTVNHTLKYTIIKPAPGEWTPEYKSSVGQTIYCKIVYMGGIAAHLSVNPVDGDKKEENQATEPEEDSTVESEEKTTVKKGAEYEFTGTAEYKGEPLDAKALEALGAKLVIEPAEPAENGEKASEEIKMDVKDGALKATYTFKKPGEYNVYYKYNWQAGGRQMSGKSTVLSITVTKAKSYLWLIILIIVLLLLIAALLVWLFFVFLPNRPTSVTGGVSMKLMGRSQSGNSMVFEKHSFDAGNVFRGSHKDKFRNTLTDLIKAYSYWYNSIYDSELEKKTYDQYVNRNLTEVTDKIKVLANKSGKTTVTVPPINKMAVNGMEIVKPKDIMIGKNDCDIELKFENGENSYILELTFSKTFDDGGWAGTMLGGNTNGSFI